MLIVTIFVNPTQFAPGETDDAYPRTLDADMEALGQRWVLILLWAPSVTDATQPRIHRIDGPGCSLFL